MNTATTTTTTLTLNESFLSRRNWFDWLFAALVLGGGLFALQRYAAFMDGYEKGICWAPFRPLSGWAGSGAHCGR